VRAGTEFQGSGRVLGWAKSFLQAPNFAGLARWVWQAIQNARITRVLPAYKGVRSVTAE